MTAKRLNHADLYSRWDHQSGSSALLVYFNGYGNQAKGVQTRLDSFATLSLHGTSTLWFAEAGDLSWYTAFDERIQETIRFAARAAGIRRLLLLGSSAGGYAAIRHAALIHDVDAELDSVCAVAVNPQSGFSAARLNTIRARMAEMRWPAADLGLNPILPRTGRIHPDHGAVVSDDLCQLLARPRQRADATEFHVYYDAGNPIDSGFAEPLGGALGVHLHPAMVGKSHRDSCGAVLTSEPVQARIEQALGVEPGARLIAAPTEVAVPAPAPAPVQAPVEAPVEAPVAAAPIVTAPLSDAPMPQASAPSAVPLTGPMRAHPAQGPAMKPYLALFRTGASSLHPSAVERLAEQNFDYALSHFGDNEPPAKGAVFVHHQKGAKWPGLEQTLLAHWDTIQKYQYVWLPDDDLLCVPEDVSRMFAICDDLKLELAQPALTRDSYHTHIITLQHPSFQLRFTNFVEIMAPIMSIEMLKRVFHTLAGNISGYGLDTLWPRMSQVGRIAIIDDTPVKHTRPVGGPNYAFSKKAGLAPVHEAWLCSASHLVDTPADFQINLAGLLQNGDPICIGSTNLEINTVLKAVIESCDGLPISALQLTHYLGNHFNYWVDGAYSRTSYPRGLLRVVLNQTLKHAGIKFPKPPAPVTATSAASAATETEAAKDLAEEAAASDD
jgi:hypothetical protein